MAKPQKPDQNGKIKVRIIELEMEGSDDSLQEGLKSLAAALHRGGNPVVVTRIKNEGTRQLQAPTANELTEEHDELEDIDAETEIDAATTKPRSQRRPAKIVPATILQDIRLDDVDPTFKDFATEKAPTSDMSRYLVVAYWFKFHKNVNNLTGDHFYTAYKIMSWKVPRDPVQPARDLRAGRVVKFSTGTDPGTFMINQVGENSVTEMGS